MRHLDWDRDGTDWPNRDYSDFVEAGRLRWHVQQMGQGPVLLLLHGTGASTHSWRGLMPLLASQFRVIAPDLPGHGFTSPASSTLLSLPGMARAVGDLLQKLDANPVQIAGHSAGAAVAIQMAVGRQASPDSITSINGALLPWRGLAGQIFSPMAKVLASTSIAPRLFARQAGQQSVIERMVRETGSAIDDEGVELYRRLAAASGHVSATLGMMANWDLHSLQPELRRLKTPVHFIIGENDRTILPRDARRAAAQVPGAKIASLPGLGHLAHEEAPEKVAEIIIPAASGGKTMKAAGVR